MSRSVAKSTYITPMDTSGAPIATTKQAGVFTLQANTTYYYIIPCEGSPYASVTVSGMTSALVLTSVTVQDTDHPFGGAGGVLNNSNASNYVVAGALVWCPEGSSSSIVGVTGTGWTATNGVIAAAGTGFGIARFNIEGTGAFRTRIEVVVGATGGDLMLSTYGKA